LKREEIIKKTGETNPMKASNATMEFMLSDSEGSDDSDDDHREFADASVEEAEDRLLAQYSFKKGATLTD
jgi:hypothetical protein